MRRPTEKLPARLRMSNETCGCLMPSALPASACVIPRCLMMRYSWIVSSAFVSSCLGLGRPRSANTLPLLSVMLLIAIFGPILVMSVLPFSTVALRIGQPLPDKIEFLLRGGHALLHVAPCRHGIRRGPSRGDVVFDSGQCPLDQFDAFIAGKKLGRGTIFQNCQGRRQPTGRVLLVAERGNCVGDYRHQTSDYCW